MNHSETISQIAEALAKAQGLIQSAVKDKTNPHFKSDYASLASCWDACRAALSSNGLAVIQFPAHDDGIVTIDTLLTHASGEWMRSSCSVRAAKGDAQSLGAAQSYLRRYGLCAMTGIAPADDDDGNAASGDQAGVTSRTAERPVKVLTLDEVTVPKGFWDGERYAVTGTGNGVAQWTVKATKYAREAPNLDALSKLEDDNSVYIERARDKDPAAVSDLIREINEAKSVFLAAEPEEENQ
jgi:hypothetical protein